MGNTSSLNSENKGLIRDIDISELFAFNYTPSTNGGTLEWDLKRTPKQVHAIEADASYKEFTDRIYLELLQNSDIAKAYTQAFHNRRALNQAYAKDYVKEGNNYRYNVGKALGIFRADGSINPDAWLENRKDGKWGLVHESRFKDNTIPVTPLSNKTLPTLSSPLEPPTDLPSNPFTSTDTPYMEETKSRWTDWIPILSKYFANNRAARKDAQLQKLIVYPKLMPKERHAIKTDAYLQRQLLEKQKQEIIARGDAIQTSNIDDRLRIMDRVHDIALLYSDRQAQLQSAEYLQTSEDVTKALNYNISERVDTANHNLKVDAATRNNIVNAERNKLAKLTSNWNSAVDSLYHDFGKWKHDLRLDERRKQELELKAGLNKDIADIESKTENLINPKNWEHLTNFAAALSHPSAGLTTEEAELLNKWRNDPITGLKSDAAYRNLLTSKLESGQDPVSTRWRGQWSDYVDRIKRYGKATSTRLLADYSRILSLLPTIIDNLIWTYTPRRRQSSLMKEGGKVKLLLELAKRNLRAKEEHDKNFNDALKREADQLRNLLDVLDKEQLLLLKAMFK